MKEHEIKAVNEISDVLIDNKGKMLIEVATAIYNAGYRKQDWISVEDRLPEDSMTVITFNMSGEVDADYYAAYSLGFTDKTVTHWMPLPEPPKMKGGE